MYKKLLMTRCRKLTSQKYLFVSLFLLLIVSIYYMNKWVPDTPFTIATSDLDRAVELISRLRSQYPSLYGLRYRSMICAIVRNDPHLLEFLLRNLISGFSHIVVYDNNRIKAGHDVDISKLLAPFIIAGAVTHVPWEQGSTDQLDNGAKNANSAQCLEKYGKHADWVTILDTDEYFYYEKQNVSVNSLNELLLELEKQSVCAIGILWTMMYGEARILKPNKTLFESYPRVCKTIGQTKILARPWLTNLDIPHNAVCNRTNYTSKIWTPNTYSKIGLVHYYSKSMEEFLVKADQSIPPYVRKPIQSYIDTGPICDRVEYHYSEDYRIAFFNAHRQMKALHSLEPIHLLSPPTLNVHYMPSKDDYMLLIYLKYRCAKRQEFDNEKYLATNQDARQAVANRSVTDGLHHYLLNFAKGAKGCWKTDTYSVCE